MQTWEDSELPDPLTGLPGDNDPLDFIEVGGAAAPLGAVYDMKVLGALGLIDANETDYKVRAWAGCVYVCGLVRA
jgi:inorganic pyrophosphatase